MAMVCGRKRSLGWLTHWHKLLTPSVRWRSLGWLTQWHWQELLTPWGRWRSLGWLTQWHWQKPLTGLREVKKLGVTDTVTLTEATDQPEGGEEAWGDQHSDTDRSYWPAWGRWRSLGWLTQWQELLTGLREVKELGVTDTVTGATDWPEGGEGAWGDWHSDIDRSYWSHSLNRPQSHASLNLGEGGPLLVLVANYQLRSSALPLRKYFPWYFQAPPPPPPPTYIYYKSQTVGLWKSDAGFQVM